jgi:hypothetical protein
MASAGVRVDLTSYPFSMACQMFSACTSAVVFTPGSLQPKRITVRDQNVSGPSVRSIATSYDATCKVGMHASLSLGNRHRLPIGVLRSRGGLFVLNLPAVLAVLIVVADPVVGCRTLQCAAVRACCCTSVLVRQSADPLLDPRSPGAA